MRALNAFSLSDLRFRHIESSTQIVAKKKRIEFRRRQTKWNKIRRALVEKLIKLFLHFLIFMTSRHDSVQFRVRVVFSRLNSILVPHSFIHSFIQVVSWNKDRCCSRYFLHSSPLCSASIAHGIYFICIQYTELCCDL